MAKTALRLAAALALTGCAAPDPAHGNAALTAFLCDRGYYFWVEYLDGQVRIFTSAGTFQLAERPSSIGRKFSSETAAFIHDEDRAALNGLPGGPFRQCRQVMPDASTSLPPLPEAIEIEDRSADGDPILENIVNEPT